MVNINIRNQHNEPIRILRKADRCNRMKRGKTHASNSLLCLHAILIGDKLTRDLPAKRKGCLPFTYSFRKFRLEIK